MNTKIFIEQGKKMWGNMFDYNDSMYVNSKTKIKIKCIKHNNEFLQLPNNHLRFNGCCKCNNKFTKIDTEEYIKKCVEIYKNRYTYSKTIYTGSKNLVTITCPIFGDFKIKANYFITRYYEYTGENKRNAKQYNNKTLYIVNLFNNEDSFIKIGITGQTVEERFYTINRKYYDCIPLLTIENESSLIHKLEKYLHKQLILHKYVPKIKFNGYTECFKDININKISETINLFFN